MPPRPARAALLALLVGPVLAASACSSQQAVVYRTDWPAFEAPAQLLSAADLVIAGEVMSAEVREVPLPSGGVSQVSTVYDVDVDRVVKGDAAVGRTSVVRQPGGELGGTTYEAPDVASLTTGDRYLMFLTTAADVPALPLNPTQAVYRVEDDGSLTPVSGDGLPVDAGLAEPDPAATADPTGTPAGTPAATPAATPGG